MEKAGISIPGLKSRDELAAINGSNFSTDLTTLMCFDCENAEIACEMSLEALKTNLKHTIVNYMRQEDLKLLSDVQALLHLIVLSNQLIINIQWSNFFSKIIMIITNKLEFNNNKIIMMQ